MAKVSNARTNSALRSAGAITVSDHTLIVGAVMEHSLAVLHFLPRKFKVSRSSIEGAGVPILEAALKVPAIKKSTKRRIELVIAMLRKMQDLEEKLPRPAAQAMADLRKLVKGKSPAQQIRIFRNSKIRRRYAGRIGVVEGMDVAAAILEHGQQTIYSLSFPFYETFQQGPSTSAIARDALSDIGSADSIGGAIAGAATTTGAAIGWGAGPAGAAAGAVAGAAVGGAFAAGMSVGMAIGCFWDWVFD